MVANKSQALIGYILNAKMNEKDLHVAVLSGRVDLTPTESQMCGINMFVHGKQAFICLPKVSRKSLYH